mmetsp:Transcript_54642/g.127776  ORF Transcript_54642/g.127776 Transcript_54642/m.127776 type:complete len:357 (+) Transcript_54642:52-1122(+)
MRSQQARWGSSVSGPSHISGEPRRDAPPAKALVPGLEHRQFSDEEIKLAFDTFDLDKNRFVGAMEIRHILDLIGEEATDEEVDEMIRMCDNDGDGQVTFDEFFKLMTQPPPPLPPPAARPERKVVRDADQYKQFDATESAKKSTLTAHGLFGPVSAQSESAAKQMRLVSVEALVKKLTNGMEKIKPNQIKKVYKRFQDIDSDNSGVIEYEEFIQALDIEDNQTSRQMFRVFDMDGSGSIELKEFIVVLSRYTAAAKTEKLKFAFMMYDEDGSGTIEREELINMLRASFVVENLSVEELEAKADAIFDFLKLPKQGHITYDNFLKLSQSQQGLVYPLEATQHVNQDFSINKMVEDAG